MAKLRGVSAKPNNARKTNDLDALAGSWTKEEADAFDEHLADQRKIDPELFATSDE